MVLKTTDKKAPKELLVLRRCRIDGKPAKPGEIVPWPKLNGKKLIGDGQAVAATEEALEAYEKAAKAEAARVKAREERLAGKGKEGGGAQTRGGSPKKPPR